MDNTIKIFLIRSEKDVFSAKEEISREQKANLMAVMLDFRNSNLGQKELKKIEAAANQLRRENEKIGICKIDINSDVWIEIKCEKEYALFFQEFAENNNLKEEFKESFFTFYIYLESQGEKQSVDEQRLFNYFLIANQYGADRFSVVVLLTNPSDNSIEENKWENSNYYRVCTYSTIQKITVGMKGKVKFNSKNEKVIEDDVSKIGKILSAFTVTEESLKMLISPVDEKIWTEIRAGKVDKSNVSFEDILVRLCWRYLFGSESPNTQLNYIREKMFLSKDFYTLIEGIPLIALLIFAEFDFFSRLEMLEEFKSKLTDRKQVEGKKSFPDSIEKQEDDEQKKYVRINISDLLEDYQAQQEYSRYCIHQDMLKTGRNNKSMFVRRNTYGTGRGFKEICEDLDNTSEKSQFEAELYETYGLHTQIIMEVYEAVAVSEGLIQLIDNVVTHVGKGLMSMRIHSLDDKTVLKERYPSYFLKRNDTAQSGYYLEVKISDLSGTNIAEKFKSNYTEFKDGLDEEGKKIFDNFNIKSFFAPNMEEENIWKLFYGESQNVVNHYGLQIFDSIIRSRDGFFTVASGKDLYASEIPSDNANFSFIPGTAYTILLPLDNRSSEDKNIYDSMLAYDVSSYLKNRSKREVKIYNFSEMERPDYLGRKNYFDNVCQEMGNHEVGEDTINVIDVSKVSYLEGTVKGALLFLFHQKEKNVSKTLKIAFVNCKTYQIVEIVRLISLSYNKMGLNQQMNNVQIYIKGKNIGEEIIFFGETLPEVGNNIMKLACMRGTLYDNYQTINALLKRK